MPAKKKHPSTRARRNKTPGAATLARRPLSVVTEPVDYSERTVAQLKDLIDERNGPRATDDKLSKRGSKASLVTALQRDDEELAGPPRLPVRNLTDADGFPIADWHEQTRSWWADIWSSPMSDEWDESDLHNAILCALLYDDMWRGETAKARKDAAAEFRLQRASLGLDPYSRRRLEWQIEATDEAQTRGNQRRSAGTPVKQQAGKAKRPDPRAGLASVN